MIFRTPPLNRYGTVDQQCSGKEAYRTKKLARAVARRYGCTVYRCKVDRRHWHITSRRVVQP